MSNVTFASVAPRRSRSSSSSSSPSSPSSAAAAAPDVRELDRRRRVCATYGRDPDAYVYVPEQCVRFDGDDAKKKAAKGTARPRSRQAAAATRRFVRMRRRARRDIDLDVLGSDRTTSGEATPSSPDVVLVDVKRMARNAARAQLLLADAIVYGLRAMRELPAASSSSSPATHLPPGQRFDEVVFPALQKRYERLQDDTLAKQRVLVRTMVLRGHRDFCEAVASNAARA